MADTKLPDTKSSDTKLAAPAPLLEIDAIETCYGLSQVLFGLSP